MKQRASIFFAFLFFSFLAHSQTCDPWIQQAYQQLYKRNATTEECNIRNYNNGSWNNYNELVQYIKTYNEKKQATSSATCDPWIQQAYKQLYNRVPNADECNIKLYNNGSWNNYDELVRYIKQYNNSKQTAGTIALPVLKGDPWIFRAYKELYNREPNAWEINTKNYNNGTWNNYAELKGYVRDLQKSFAKQNLEIKTGPWSSDKAVVGFFIDGKQVAVDVVSTNGGLVVSAGGANVVAAGGANVIAPGGANVIAPGGANIAVNTSMAGVNFGNKYVTQSEGTRVVTTSGNGAIIIR